MDKQPATRKPPREGPATSVETGPTIEQELLKVQERLDLLRAQVRQAQQLSSLGAGAAMIAHEFNNLLTPIFSYCKAALDADDRDLQQRALRMTLKNVQMLIAMSERVLKISAASPAKREHVHVRAAAHDAAASLCRDLSKDGIRFIVSVDESVTVWADSLQLQQVLFNLFLNAREAMAESHGGRLTISARCQADKVFLEVRNTGEAIPPDLLPFIFDPLQSSKATARNERARCTGLGLALCRDLVEENDGTISVTSEPDRGTTFTIALPSIEPGKR